MTEMSRRWRVLATGMAFGVTSVVGFAAAATASAQPTLPQPPLPSPYTVTQPVAATPNAAPTGQAMITPATSGTLNEFLSGKGVTLERQSSTDFKALTIVLPMPKGWTHVPDPNVPDAFAVLADRVGGNGLYTTNAQLKVYKLVGGEFDPKEAISHGFVDSQQLPAWRSTDASMADLGGMPSSVIEGTYRENSMTLNTSRRNVIAVAGPDRYLVSLAVTTSVDQVVAAAGATDAVVNGFRVSLPGGPVVPVTPTQAPPPASTTAGLAQVSATPGLTG